ncbi:transcriptional regulator, GntR family [Actinacidiphila yanglinensis]|uniref:Transcriptional regulator, GntR family n=1 Tax=Actinacidiphila yanglinensis TaxID=310779 RepID=A0A1H6E8W8_9ACTN|nr:PLP-dependent aminotransferase family protein [Actinacidiphila yanglinensis]SEG93723.1 transcriptional regulator, GntR family [Actinacidiphila yanglinensis]
MDLHLDLPSGPGQGGRRAALERALRAAVRDGRLAPGARLPSTRRLAADTGVARGTVKAAYDQLVAEGYLDARQGSGTVVAGRPAPPQTPAGGGHRPRAPRHDLRPGSPDVTSFPAPAWVRATRRALAAAPSAAYDYGDPCGRIELRTALAEYLGRARGVVAEPGRIVITSGYVQALALLVRVAARTVAMEDPGLPFHRDVVRRAGGRVVALPTDGRGARTHELAAGAGAVDAVVVTPAHQYPTGVTLHPSRRHALTAWARASGGLVVEDDYDGEFRYDRQPVGALQGTAPDHVVYVGTASKTLGPALRLGWMVLPPHLVGPVAEEKLHTDFHTGALGQLALAELIRDHGYDRHVRACRSRYRRRRDLLVARLERAYGTGAAGSAGGPYGLDGIAAGLHAVLTLPAGELAEADVRRRAARLDLAVGTLGDHWHEEAAGPEGGAHRPQGLIVGYGTPAEGAYPAALDALVNALTRP